MIARQAANRSDDRLKPESGLFSADFFDLFSGFIVRVNVYYDAQLIQILPDEGKGEMLAVKYGEQEITLPADPAGMRELHEMHGLAKARGQTGAARLVVRKADGTPARYRFDIYPDQTLKRTPELDVFEYNPDGYNVNCIGWKNESNPAGFLAPKGIIPGVQGHFISDSTESFEVDVPYEFTDLCIRFHRDPVAVLRDFIAHAGRLKNTAEHPRGDGFKSRSEKAEELIARYLDLVYGHGQPDN